MGADYVATGQESPEKPASAYAIGLWGDLPYSDLHRTTGVPNLIADMNSQRLAFSVHEGDIKSGSSRRRRTLAGAGAGWCTRRCTWSGPTTTSVTSPPTRAEWEARDRATNAWMRETFDQAKASGAAVVPQSP